MPKPLQFLLLTLAGAWVGYRITRLQAARQVSVADCDRGHLTPKVVRATPPLAERIRRSGEDGFLPHAVPAAGNLKPQDKYRRDLERWGTREGVMEVSNDEDARQKKKQQVVQFGLQGQRLTQRFLKNLEQELASRGVSMQDPKAMPSALLASLSKTQVSITNPTDSPRVITLWGANRARPVSPPQPEDVQDHVPLEAQPVPEALGLAVHPLGTSTSPTNCPTMYRW